MFQYFWLLLRAWMKCHKPSLACLDQPSSFHAQCERRFDNLQAPWRRYNRYRLNAPFPLHPQIDHNLAIPYLHLITEFDVFFDISQFWYFTISIFFNSNCLYGTPVPCPAKGWTLCAASPSKATRGPTIVGVAAVPSGKEPVWVKIERMVGTFTIPISGCSPIARANGLH